MNAYERAAGAPLPESGPAGATRPAILVPEADAVALLAVYGIPYPAHAVATSAAEAVDSAERLGYPVVLKVISRDVVHKSDAGGVRVGLFDAEKVRQAFGEIVASVAQHSPCARVDGVLVCRQALPGTDIIVGAFLEEVFGPSVAVGMGGIWAEVLQDVAFRVAPVDGPVAREMLCDLAAYPMLTGARGQPAADLEALESLIVAVSRLIVERPEIVEIDLNPVRVYETSVLALDARILASDPTNGGHVQSILDDA